MDPRLFLALIFGKTIAKILKARGSGATAAPGLYALKIDPNLVKKISRKNNLSSIVISGTNGKTTTSRLISSILSSKYKIISNRQGSNLLRGVASTIIDRSTFWGHLEADMAIWETDEAALAEISKQVKIKVLLLLNLFRDQLDRYGEIDTTRKRWLEVVKNLERNTYLIINSDDPSTNYLGKFSKAQNVYFGVEEQKINLPEVENVADVKYCINCGAKLSYKKLFSAHLGIYSCIKCNFKRQTPQIKATLMEFKPNFSTKLTITTNGKPLTVNPPLPGLFSVYNVLAATALAKTLEMPEKTIISKINNFSPAFGRFESITIGKKSVTIFLIKNPAGANEVIRTIATKDNLNVLAILNDNIADGRDVSWIWDTNWEVLKNKVNNIFVAGTRAHDLALRLKYANFKILKPNVSQELEKIVNRALESSNDLIILPTYTSLLAIKTSLQSQGGTKWQEE